MVVKEGSPQNPHPEGLTPEQKGLADLLISTKIEAKVRRRRELPDETFEFYEVVRPTTPIDFAQEGEFALKLHETRPDAPLSPIHINLRNLPEHILQEVGRVLAEIPFDERPDFCVGIPNAGVPIALAYSKFSGVPVFDIFTKEETEAGRRIVAGKELQQEEGKVLLVDDLVTEAHTKLEAIKEAESLGYGVIGVLVLVDREQGGKEQLAKAGYKLYAAFTLPQLLAFYRSTGKITPERHDEVINYLRPNR